MTASVVTPVEAEFEVFYWEHLARLRRFLGRRIGDRQTREDLETTIMTLAWRNFAGRPGQDRTFGWLAGIAGGAVANERRAQRRRSALHERLVGHRGELGRAGPEPSVDGLLNTDRRVARTLLALSPDDRDVLLLHDWDELTYPELAAALGANEATARKRVSRARARFAASWAALGVPGDD